MSFKDFKSGWILLGMLILLSASENINFTKSDNFKSVKSFHKLSSEEINRLAKNRKYIKKAYGRKSFDQPEKFFEYQKAIRTRAGATYPDYSTAYQIKELDKARTNIQVYNARTQAYNFKERGPANVPGRTRTLLVLLIDPSKNSWIAGAVGGGIWKTTNGGDSWINKSPDIPNLSVVSLGMSESDHSIIYAGTGESYGSSGYIEISGQGMFKSGDGGETWDHLDSTTELFQFMSVNRIIVDPDNPDIVLISANQNVSRGLEFNSGIFKSTDGGSTWRQVYQPNAWVQQITYVQGNFNIQYAAVFNTGVAKSEDAGETWRMVSSGFFPAGRLELAISPTNSQVLYAASEGELSGVDSDLYISEDGGMNWQLVIEENDQPNRNFFAASENSTAQGSWNNTLAVHPFYDSIVYVGGVDIWKMNIVPGEVSGERGFIGVTEQGTEDFMEFVNFNSGSLWGNRLATGDIDDSLFVSVELRFGPGKKQMAHRFLTPVDGGTDSDGGAGIPDDQYEYADYVEVPFEVWDIKNNRQLMVSFRDQARNGVWDLIPQNTVGAFDTQSREYFFIHVIPYDPDAPAPEITIDGGHAVEQMYFMWPYLKDNTVFDPQGLPDSKLSIKWDVLIKRLRKTIRMTSWAGKDEENGRILDYVHADQHSIIPVITNEILKEFKLILTNDGGVFQSVSATNPGVGDESWLFSGKGFNTSQFYGVDKRPGFDQYVGGLQDNGSYLSSPRESASKVSEYNSVGGGDGMETVWNYGNDKELIISVYNNQFSKSIDGGNNWFDATSGLTDIGSDAPFISKLGNSKSQPEVLYALGASGVWRSSDFGNNWEVTEINDFWPLTTTLDVEVSLADYSIVWAGAGMSEDERIYVSTNAGKTFSVVNNYDEVSLGPITGIATHPDEDSTAYLLYSFAGTPKIIRTTNLGQSWEDISGFGTDNASSNGFPDVVVHCLLVMPHDTDIIWAGTEIGIFESLDNGSNWSLITDFPSVSVWDMKQVDDQIVIGTHGRGIWSAEIPELPEIPVTPVISHLGVNLKSQLGIYTNMRSSYDSTIIYFDGEAIGIIGATPKSDQIIYVNYEAEEKITVYVESYLRGKRLRSNSESIELFLPDEVLDKYVNEFDDEETHSDFSGNGFLIRSNTGFEANNLAIHTLHPYTADSQHVFQLKKPIRIAENNSFFYYDDIAIIETGETGSEFGDDDFWDYVVVEGSEDGVQWMPLEDGYDARYDTEWLTAYNENTNGNDRMFVPHVINLHNTFNPGDTVFFRFRLFSDDFETGWGWVIDNLYIQEPKPVGIEDKPSAFNEIKTYPNPFTDRLTVQFAVGQAGDTDLEVLDINGKRIISKSLGMLNQGKHSFDINVVGLRQGLYFVKLSSNRETQLIKVVKK